MLTRKSASNDLEFDDDSIHASSSFELTTKYNMNHQNKEYYFKIVKVWKLLLQQ